MNFQSWWNSEERFESDGFVETAESAWDAALELVNPWRYPSRGELPEVSGEYEVSLTLSWDDLLDAREFDETIKGTCTGTRLYLVPTYGITFADSPPRWLKVNALDKWEVYAWRELPEPAPELEV